MTHVSQTATPWRRASWVAFLFAFVGATTAVAKVPLLPDTTPVTERFTGPEFAALTTLTAIAAVLWLISWFGDGRHTRFTRAHAALLALCGAIVLATATAAVLPLAVVGDSGRYTGMTTWLCCAVLFFLATQLVDSSARLRTITWVFIAVGAAEGLLGVLQVLGVDPMRFVFPEAHGWMLSQGIGTIGNPNQFSSVLVIPFVLACGEILSARSGRSQAIFSAAAALMLTSLVVSATRGSWIGALAGLLTLAVIAMRCKQTSVKRLLVGSVALVVVLLAAFAVADHAIMATRFDTGAPGSSAVEHLSNGRLMLWRQSAVVFAKAPLVGVGPDSIRNALKAAGQTSGAIGVFTDDPHSLPILIAVSFGLVGLAACAWLFAAVLAAPVKLALSAPQCPPSEARARANAWLGAVLGLLVTSLVSVLSIPMLTSLFVALGVLHAPTAANPALNRTVPRMPALAASTLVAAFIAVSLWASLTPVYHNLRIDRVELVTPLPAATEQALDAADHALPWRYDTMMVRTSWLVQQAAHEHMSGNDSDTTGSGRLEAIRRHTDARVKRFPADYFAWLMRVRSYQATVDMLGGAEHLRAAQDVLGEAQARFPNDPELIGISEALARL